jgi:hypothetical protein
VVDLETMNKCLTSKWLWKLETIAGVWQSLVGKSISNGVLFLSVLGNPHGLISGGG